MPGAGLEHGATVWIFLNRANEITASDYACEVTGFIGDERPLPVRKLRIPVRDQIGKLTDFHLCRYGWWIAIHHFPNSQDCQRIDTVLARYVKTTTRYFLRQDGTSQPQHGQCVCSDTCDQQSGQQVQIVSQLECEDHRGQW